MKGARNLATSEPSGSTWLFRLFGLLGVLACYGALSSGYRAWHFVRSSERVRAVVIENERKTSTDDNGRPTSIYYPVFEYSFAEKTYKVQSSFGQGPNPRYSSSDPIWVRVSPTAPDSAEIDGFMEIWGNTLVFSVIALFLTLTFWLLGRLQKKRPELKQLKITGVLISGEVIEVSFQKILGDDFDFAPQLQRTMNWLKRMSMIDTDLQLKAIVGRDPNTGRSRIFDILLDRSPRGHLPVGSRVSIYLSQSNPEIFHIEDH